MENQGHILLLAGSAEARQIAAALAAAGIPMRALKTEPPRGDAEMSMPFELCEDVTPDRLAGLMAGAVAVIDASHGFDADLSAAGAAAAARLGVPIVALSRPAWDTSQSGKWQTAASPEVAMGLIAPGARVFATTGWASLRSFAAFPGARLFLRQTAAHDRAAPFDFVEPVFGAAPFTVNTEAALFRSLRIDTLLARNLGGVPSRPKLDAALALDLDVILIDRPPKPPGLPAVATVEEVMAWLEALP